MGVFLVGLGHAPFYRPNGPLSTRYARGARRPRGTENSFQAMVSEHSLTTLAIMESAGATGGEREARQACQSRLKMA